MNKQILLIAGLSLLFSLFMIAYLMVWLSGVVDDSQYIDCYRVLVSAGAGFTFYEIKKLLIEL